MQQFKYLQIPPQNRIFLNVICDCKYEKENCVACQYCSVKDFAPLLEKAKLEYNRVIADPTLCQSVLQRFECEYELMTVLNCHLGRVYLRYDPYLRPVIIKRLYNNIIEMISQKSSIYMYYSTRQYKEILQFFRSLKQYIDSVHTDRQLKCTGCHKNHIKPVVRRNTRSTIVPDKYIGKAVYVTDIDTGKYKLYWNDYCHTCKEAESAKFE